MESANKMRIPLTLCGFHLQLRVPQELNLTIQMFYHLFVYSTNCSGFHKYCCGFRKFAYFWSNFERYNDLGICSWNTKRHRRSKKSKYVADSATKLILACCGFCLQCRECTVWPRSDSPKICSRSLIFAWFDFCFLLSSAHSLSQKKCKLHYRAAQM